ncbi:MAG: adenylate kinase [Paramuribaculum sp.]|nr:adenylate kinase [Paramuribaculum sp.]
MNNIVIFGAPGCGKGTQSEKLIKRYGLHHISTGEVLRDHIARDTELGRVANQYISQGKLIPDELMIDILAHTLDNEAKDAKGVIFDGFPRTLPQAHALKEMLRKRGTDIHAVIGLDVPEDVLTERLINRGIQTGRADDNPETIKKRLEVYHNQTTPLKGYYTDENLYHNIPGNQTPEDVFEEIARRLDPIFGIEEQQ